MSDFKKLFHAARAYREQNLSQASKVLGVSETFLHKFLNGEATSAPLEKKIKTYIYKSELDRSVRSLCNDLNIDPDQKMKKASV